MGMSGVATDALTYTCEAAHCSEPNNETQIKKKKQITKNKVYDFTDNTLQKCRVFVILHQLTWLSSLAIAAVVDKYDAVVCPEFGYEDLKICLLYWQNFLCSCTFYFDLVGLLSLEMLIRHFQMSAFSTVCLVKSLT